MKILIKNVDIYTGLDDKILEKTNLYIKDERIYHIGSVLEDFQPDKIIDGEDKLLMAGLINSHSHIAMSIFRNYGDDLPLQDWLNDKIWPAEAQLEEEDVYWASLLSLAEMIKSGTTSFNDMYFFLDSIAKASLEAGMRGALSLGMIDVNGGGEKDLRQAEEDFNNWNGAGDGLIKVYLGPHSPYTCTSGYLKRVLDLAGKLDTSIHIHLSETRKEVEDIRAEYGMSPIELVESLGLFTRPTIGAHCVHLSDKDIEILRDNKVLVANNPGSNLKLASGFAPVDKMIKAGVKVALATDGSSSNNNLDMFEEIYLASVINKAVNLDAESVPARQALDMATINGAYCLGLEDQLARVEVGRLADLIILDQSQLHHNPKNNRLAGLAYSNKGTDVETVIINGKIVMEDKILKTIDEEKVIFKVNKIARRILKN